jgi:hypothetical protein
LFVLPFCLTHSLAVSELAESACTSDILPALTALLLAGDATTRAAAGRALAGLLADPRCERAIDGLLQAQTAGTQLRAAHER